jgi:small subunit ribosomal protein S2
MSEENEKKPPKEERKSVDKGADLSLDQDNKNKYDLSLEAMLKAGVHFGHKKSRWNPKMKKFVFGLRNGVHIIDLEKSLSFFEKALKEVKEVTEKNGIILVVGTKKQAKDLVRIVGEKTEFPHVSERWLGGTFTNFDIIKKRIKYLVDQRELLNSGKLKGMTKLEKNRLEKKLAKIDQKMGGLVKMTRLPDLVFVLDICKDSAVVAEAKNLGIKVIGLVDTNSDPDKVDFPVPANDDALSSLKYILGVFLKTVMEAKEMTDKKNKEDK